MAVTFQRKIILRPGSVFCFGTISSVADEEGTLHRIADPPRKKSPPATSENIGVRQGKAQPPALRKKIAFSKPGAEGPLTRRTPLSTSPTKGWTQIARKKETNKTGGSKLFFLCLRPQRRTERRSPRQPHHSTPTSSSSGEWSRPPSLTTSRLHLERNLLSGNPADGGTDAEISSDITRPESGTRSSLYRETMSQK
jgi:hypothetical protein